MDGTEHDRKSDAPDESPPPGAVAETGKQSAPEAFGRAKKPKPTDQDAAPDAPDKSDKPEKPPFYKRPLVLIIVGTVLVVGIVVGLLWWLHARQFESTDDAFVDGHVIPMSPKVAAIVKSVRVDDNWMVKAGDVLVELDPRDYEVALDQMRAAESAARGKLARAQTQLPVARANVGDAEAGVTVARTTAENARQDYQRVTSLDPRARSQQQLDAVTAANRNAIAQVTQAEAKLSAAQAQVADAEQAIKTAQADVERAVADVRQAQINLGYCTITAPEAGKITRKSVEPGQYLQVGQPLFSIVPTAVWVTANFKETQLELMRVGQPVDISIDAYSDTPFHGKVDSIQNGTGSRFTLLPPENATGNYVKVVQRVPVKIVFDQGETNDTNHLLAPGLSVVPKVRVR